ncbi:TPA_asm: hypothetical protein [Porphyromonas phage phage017a_JCVISC001]|uniref:Uncharacterized protein n=1 Tax=Porphyromonas phage phage017a_JCVISC001 TaxID=3154107 RepID=A0AAT9JLC9_9CAUD
MKRRDRYGTSCIDREQPKSQKIFWRHGEEH